MRISRGLLALCVVAGGLLGAQSTEGGRTIERIAFTLKRLGEDQLAERLQADFKAGRVKFGKLYDYVVIQNLHDTAEVRAGRGGWGGASTNTMTINERYEATNRAGERPERKSSSLVSLASTMVHEYVHMGQDRPAHTAAFEEPATRAQEKAMARWLDRLEREALEASGPDRAVRMAEVKGLLAHLESELGGLKDLTNRGVSQGFIRAETTWGWDELLQRVREVRKQASEPQPASGKQGSWSGTWKTNFGPLVITQRGNAVTGSYSHDGGRLTGTVRGQSLTGTWVEATDQGTFAFQLAPDGKSFSGSWKETAPSPNQGGHWNGTR